jgi:hypothetical protein
LYKKVSVNPVMQSKPIIIRYTAINMWQYVYSLIWEFVKLSSSVLLIVLCLVLWSPYDSFCSYCLYLYADSVVAHSYSAIYTFCVSFHCLTQNKCTVNTMRVWANYFGWFVVSTVKTNIYIYIDSDNITGCTPWRLSPVLPVCV